MSFRKSFLWGGATASNQIEGGYLEGGKGLSIADVITAGSRTSSRKITYRTGEGIEKENPFFPSTPFTKDAILEIHDNKYYPSHKAIDFYLNYCKTIFTQYKEKVKYWITFNEINMMEIGPILGGGVVEPSPQAIAQSLYHQFLGSALAVQLAHEINPDNKIGSMTAYGTTYGLTCRPSDQVLATEENRKRHFVTDVMCRG